MSLKASMFYSNHSRKDVLLQVSLLLTNSVPSSIFTHLIQRICETNLPEENLSGHSWYASSIKRGDARRGGGIVGKESEERERSQSLPNCVVVLHCTSHIAAVPKQELCTTKIFSSFT